MTILNNFKNFFQKEDNIVNVLTPIKNTFEYGEIESAKKAQPKWWKEMPPKFDDYANFSNNKDFDKFKRSITSVKGCPAFQDIFSTGFIIKSWCDIKIFVSPEGVVESYIADDSIRNTPPGSGSSHPYIQRAGVLKGFAHWKLHPPMFFKTKKYRKFLWKGAYWYNPYLIENNIHIVPGIIDYKTQSGANINMLLPIKSEPYELNFSFGDPLVHIIPLDNKPVKIVKKLISEEEYARESNPHLKFNGSPKILKSRI